MARRKREEMPVERELRENLAAVRRIVRVLGALSARQREQVLEALSLASWPEQLPLPIGSSDGSGTERDLA